jgi:hypothetical protein
VSERTVQAWTQEARTQEKEALKARAWDLWLDCLDQRSIAVELDVPLQTVNGWLSEKRKSADFGQPPGATAKEPWGVVQHGDVWSFGADSDPSGFFGKLPDQVVENVLWLFTEPEQIVVDPFAGSGTTVEVAKRMGRRVWASDLPVDAAAADPRARHHGGLAGGCAGEADLVLLDPPYSTQAILLVLPRRAPRFAYRRTGLDCTCRRSTSSPGSAAESGCSSPGSARRR